MNVHALDLNNFTTHAQTKLTFPRTGILVIVGENGQGKSSIVEGVSWGGWGKTLRGDVPWVGDAKPACSTRVTTDDVIITRSRTGKAGGLSWEGEGVDAGASYDTPTKAQEALNERIGTHDLWRRSHVFSSADAMGFAIATDGERKRLIEAFLGLDRFEPALQQARGALKASETQLTDLRHKHTLAATRLEAARTRLQEAKRALAATNPPPPAQNAGHGAPSAPVATPTAPLAAKLKAAQAELDQLRAQLRTADRAGAEHAAEAKRLRDVLARLRADTCPTCTQAIEPTLRVRLQAEADVAAKAAEHAKVTAAGGREELEAQLDELADEVAALTKKHSHAQAANMSATATYRAQQQAHEQAEAAHRAELQRYERGRMLLEQALRQADDEIAKVTGELEVLTSSLEHAEQEVGVLTACEQVLGLKGVRAHVLGRSLAGIEGVANTWMARLHGTGRIALKPYSEKGPADAISLTIDGIGRGTYKSNSGGERRRVDVSLLLALAEVSAAARGVKTGTLFMDEVLDCLDESGVEAVASALSDIAKDRCVVVITHSKTLLERLPAARKVRVTNGTVEEI